MALSLILDAGLSCLAPEAYSLEHSTVKVSDRPRCPRESVGLSCHTVDSSSFPLAEWTWDGP